MGAEVSTSATAQRDSATKGLGGEVSTTARTRNEVRADTRAVDRAERKATATAERTKRKAEATAEQTRRSAERTTDRLKDRATDTLDDVATSGAVDAAVSGRGSLGDSLGQTGAGAAGSLQGGVTGTAGVALGGLHRR